MQAVKRLQIMRAAAGRRGGYFAQFVQKLVVQTVPAPMFFFQTGFNHYSLPMCFRGVPGLFLGFSWDQQTLARFAETKREQRRPR